MSYQKHTWVKNELIRANQLNHIENGIYGEEQRALNAEEILASNLSDETERATNAEEGLSTRITANTQDIALLNASSSTPGSVDYKIAQAVKDSGGYKVVEDHTQVVSPSTKYIYLEPDPSATGSDVFEEWIYYYDDDEGDYVWAMIGETSLDLSDYAKKTDYASSSEFGVCKVDGTTITSSNGVISAQGGSSGVTSFNGRTGAVSPTNGDYSYSQIAGTPTLGTAAALNVATSGDAGNTEVVKGNDSRLTDARTPTSHTHNINEITNFPTIPGGVKIGTTVAGATDTTLYFIRS